MADNRNLAVTFSYRRDQRKTASDCKTWWSLNMQCNRMQSRTSKKHNESKVFYSDQSGTTPLDRDERIYAPDNNTMWLFCLPSILKKGFQIGCKRRTQHTSCLGVTFEIQRQDWFTLQSGQYISILKNC